jgi:Holliday junction resolvase RusA-like endonuclease
LNNVAFVIPGKPHGKARPRFYAGHTYTPQETREYERLAAFLYKKAAGGVFFARSEQVCVHVTAVYAIPKSASKKARASMLDGTVIPTSRPDIDNVLKIVLDALNGVAYEDDAQVGFVSAEKRYGEEPCVLVTVSPIGGT